MLNLAEQNMKRASKLLLIFILLGMAIVLGGAAGAFAAGEVNVITIEGVIDPAMADYLERALGEAQENRAECLIIRLNTPGGLGKSMNEMVEALLNSPLPTVIYVAPRGAEAFSAGTFITLAAHFAVMHPDTVIGAAHPMQLIPTPEPPAEEGEKVREQSSAVMEKIVNAFATKARTIAEANGRNADWAEKAVRESATVTASQALELKVVDSLQPNMEELLKWLDGRTAEVKDKETTLHTKGAATVEIPPSAKDRFLHQLADPNLLLILLALAAMGILFELQNPGAILPGVVGGISLLLALYSISVLPVTTTGLALIGFGLLLLILDIKMPSHGILSIGGVIAFVIGAVMLVDTRYSGVVKMSWQVIVATTILLGGFFIFAIGAAVRAHLRKPTTGKEGMLGMKGKAASALSEDTRGEISIAGELWRARSRQGNIAPGEKVEVVAMEGLTLVVQPLPEEQHQ